MSSGYPDDHDEDRRDDRRAAAAARARVHAPAVAMLVCAIISLGLIPPNVINLFFLPAQLEAKRKQIDKDPNIQAAEKQNLITILQFYENIIIYVLPFSMIFNSIIGILCIIGSMKMKNLSSRGWAVTAAVLNIASVGHGCCFFTLPVGIWALVVLLNHDVSAEFAAVAHDRSRALDTGPDADRYE